MKRSIRIPSLFMVFWIAVAAIGSLALSMHEVQAEPPTAGKSAKTPKFPSPTAKDGQALLDYEGIAFVPEKNELPDAAKTVRDAAKGDAPSQFIAQMMYRDNVGDIAHYSNGKKVKSALKPAERHREMIRWRDASVEALYDLSILAAEPSLGYQENVAFDDDEPFRKGLDWLEKAAANGYGNAEYILGLAYWNGIGEVMSKSKGFELLVRAAAHGVVNAYYHIGMIYELGLKGKRDPAKALFWLEKAANLGSQDAIFIMAMKYADGIDVPKDKDKALALAKLDSTYHAWTQLWQSGFFNRYCIFRYDESDIGRTEAEGGGCEGYSWVNHDAFHDGGYSDDDVEETVESPEIAAAHSLDYKIDYRLAASWLKQFANMDRENTYILRSQTRHVTGCRGRLDGSKVDTIILYYNSGSSSDDYNDLDNYPDIFKVIIIAKEDEKRTTEEIYQWLEAKANAGNKDALFLLGVLYENLEVSDNDLRDENDDYYEGISYDHDGWDSGKSDDWLELFEDKHDLAKAFNYYQKAGLWMDARRVAISMGVTERKRNAESKAREWYAKAFAVSEMGYRDAINKGDRTNARKFALVTANAAFMQGDNPKAVEWYETALTLTPDGDNMQEPLYHLAQLDEVKAVQWYEKAVAMTSGKNVFLMRYLARLYDSGSPKVQNRDKAATLYRKILSSAIYDPPLFDAALGLGKIYERGTTTIPADIAKAIPLFQYALEFCFSSVVDCSPSDVEHIRNIIETLPKLDLQAAVERQISAEKDKDPDGFFAIDKVFKKCDINYLEDDDDYDDDDDDEREPQINEEYPYTCNEEFLKPIYEESIQKAMTAIVALSIAMGNDSPDVIRNTFYYLAIYKGNDRDHYREYLAKESAVWRKLEDEALSDDAEYLFHIWYLRQIPYAAKDVFDGDSREKSWDEYMAQAKRRMKQDAKLRTAFGYEPRARIQKLRMEN